MKRRGLISVILVITLISVLLAGCNSSQPAAPNGEEQPVVFKLGHVTQVNHPYHYAAENFANLVEERTDGRIKIEIYPARQLGGDRDLIENVQTGALDMAVASSSVFGGFSPLFDALQLPFLIDSYEVLEQAVVTDEAIALLKGLEEIDIKAFAFWDAGLRYLVLRDGIAQDLSDIRGAKLRVAEAPLHMDMFNALGTSPTPLPYGDIYSALQTGVIDGLEMDLSAIYVEKFYERAPYVTMTGHFTWPTVPIMNLELFNSLSEADQKIIADAAWETIAFNHSNIRELDEKYMGLLKEANVQFEGIEDLTPFKQATEGVYETYMSKDQRVRNFVETVLDIKGE